MILQCVTLSPSLFWCRIFNFPWQYFGIHPFVLKHSVTKAAEYANAAKTVGSALLGSLAGLSAKNATQTPMPARPQAPQSVWGWAGPAMYAVGGAVLAGAAAGGAYYKRDDLTQGLSWATDHMKYASNLWDEEALNQRVEALIDIEKEDGVIFRTLVHDLFVASLEMIKFFCSLQVICHSSTQTARVPYLTYIHSASKIWE